MGCCCIDVAWCPEVIIDWSAGHMKGLAKRVIACLDVRANDAGDLVVTKGDQYDVRDTDGAGREVRSFGAHVHLWCNPSWHASGSMRELETSCPTIFLIWLA